MNDIYDESYCLLDFEARKKWRAKYPGACAMDYENIIQIVIKTIIGWNQSEQRGYKGAFGIPLAYGDSCEEQARYTLHSHISVWLKDFNTVRNLVYNEDESIRLSAIQQLEKYFDRIAQANLGELIIARKDCAKDETIFYKSSDVLKPPADKQLRLMRHHIHCKEYHGYIGRIIDEELYDYLSANNVIDNKKVNANQLVDMNNNARTGRDITEKSISKPQLDMFAYTYPYHMKYNEALRPLDCHQSVENIEYLLNEFNTRHPLLQLRFNLHDHYHRSSCFKKGPECRAHLPQPDSLEALIYI